MASPKQNIVFFHPDLGIGGAERLIIDAAIGLQAQGHRVTIFTSHCDPTHCFDEARDGTLNVRVRGSFIPPTIFGRFAILCTILRQLHLLYQICTNKEFDRLRPTVCIFDQLSAGIPFLRQLRGDPKILFYCHFPDKLLAKPGGSLKNLYRVPFDTIESWSTGCADAIVVNSKFTQGVFKESFSALKDRQTHVVYPCVDTNPSSKENGPDLQDQKPLWQGQKILLSINRFERKKGIDLALRAYAGLSSEERRNTRLVLAGGYDPRVRENLECHAVLEALAEKELGLKTATAKTMVSALAIPEDVSVLFLLSVPNAFKDTLLRNARLLIYTPRNEHFGIVPLEAMLAGIPVLAANEGGPTETVVDGQTGWLRDVSKVSDWTAVIRGVLAPNSEMATKLMGHKGRDRVIAEFSKDAMAGRLEDEINAMMKIKDQDRPIVFGPRATIAIGIGAVIGGALMALSFAFTLLYVLPPLTSGRPAGDIEALFRGPDEPNRREL